MDDDENSSSDPQDSSDDTHLPVSGERAKKLPHYDNDDPLTTDIDNE